MIHAGNVVPFGGIFYSYLLKDIPQKSFTTIEPGASVDKTFDIASTSDLSEGGDYVLSTEGLFAIAEGEGTELTGAIKFKSNVLEINVDGKAAAKVNKAIKTVDKRANVDAGCSGSEKDALLTALQNSGKLASAAASAADGAKFEEYFRTSDASAKQTVVDRLNAVATESGSSSSGVTQYYCDDPYNYCNDGVLAWTLPTQNIISNCPLYYSAIPPLSSQCHAQDQATTTLHELTHADGVYSPFCDDHAYGYEASIALPASQALQNADSYALFANGKWNTKYTYVLPPMFLLVLTFVPRSYPRRMLELSS